MFDIVKKAKNLKHLGLPDKGTFYDIGFLKDGIFVERYSAKSEEFLQYLSNSTLLEHLSWLHLGH